MPRIEFLKGHISIPKDQKNLFQMTKLYREYVLNQEIIDNESDSVGYSEIEDQLFIEFSDLPVYNYSEIIEQDLIDFCKMFKPGTIKIDVLHWSAIEAFQVTHYFTHPILELASQTLHEAPMNPLINFPELKPFS